MIVFPYRKRCGAHLSGTGVRSVFVTISGPDRQTLLLVLVIAHSRKGPSGAGFMEILPAGVKKCKSHARFPKQCHTDTGGDVTTLILIVPK